MRASFCFCKAESKLQAREEVWETFFCLKCVWFLEGVVFYPVFGFRELPDNTLHCVM